LDFIISQENNTLLATVERDEIASVVEELFVFAAAGEEIAGEEIPQQFGDEIVTEFGGDITSAGAENTLAIADALDRVALLVDSGDIPESSELGQALARIQAIEDPVELVQAIKSLEPESSGAGSEGSRAAAGAVSAVIANRQASLRDSLYETGMVAGDDISITGFWIQGYDKDTEQEQREGVDGFDVDMYGVALGADAPIGERTTVGLAISYADSQVNSTGIENNKMAIDSYQISSYVSFNEDDYYLDALVSYARNEYDGRRNLFGGLTANADYTGDQYGVRARGGYPFVLASGVHVTPNTSVEFSYLKEEGYQEDGAGNSGLDIGSQSLTALVLAAGVKVAYPFTTESDTTWMPDFHIEVRRDFIGDEVELDTNFVGVGGAGFSTNGASVEQTAYKAGIGLRAWSQSSLSFMFRYDYTYKEDYNSHAVAGTIRYSF
jgi:outer membrane autotransporter protein